MARYDADELTVNGIKMLGYITEESDYYTTTIAFMTNDGALMVFFDFTNDEELQMIAECMNTIKLK